MTTIDFTAAARDCIARTDRMLGTHGPRLAGSPACAAAARELAEELGGFADSVSVDEFLVHPGVFYSYTKILPVAYAAGLAVLLLFPRFSLLAAIALCVGIALMLFQFAFYIHVGDGLFRRRTGRNVEGIVEPTGAAERELIISGHHDSAPVARIFSSPFRRLYALAIFVPYVFFIVELAILACRGLGAGDAPWEIPFLVAGLPFAAGYFSMVALRTGSPGAGDNLAASVMAARLGREIAQRKDELLRGTRLRIVSFDAEEAGLRGAAAYMRRRAAAARRLAAPALPCVHLNFDSLYDPRDLQVLTSDINGSVPLSRTLVDQLLSCAEERGIPLRRFALIFGAGGTDAAESARIGVPSTTLIAMPTNVFRGNLVYHTPRDTAEHIAPAVIEACMRIAVEYLRRLDSGEAELPAPGR
jgi:aminopeptidase YwaD